MRKPFACGTNPNPSPEPNQVSGCMRNPYACGTARASVALIDEPLQVS